MLTEKAFGFFNSVWEWFTGLIETSRNLSQAVWEWIQNMINTIFWIFQEGWKILSDARKLLWDWIKNITTQAYDWLVWKFNALVWAISSAVSRLKSLYTSAKNFLSWGGGDWARAFGWTMRAWKTYLVGERWPEMVTPTSTSKVNPNINSWWGVSININMGGVVVQNDADENRLVEKISNALKRETQLFNLWIN